MSKYYVLAEDTRRDWAIYAEPMGIFLEVASGSFTDLERSLASQLITNYPYNNQIDNTRRISYIITNGLSYRDAINFVSDLMRSQDTELKRVKHKYVKQHTIKYSVISRDKALRLTRSLPRSIPLKNYGDPIKIKPNSIEARRIDNYDKKNLHSIYK